MANLLIIDDDEDFAKAAAQVLTNAGHAVDIELDTTNAVKHMEEKQPDLVVLDVMFPEDSSAGFELARTMRLDNEKLKGIPILMLTAVNVKFPLGFSADDIEDTWLPVTDFIEKPVDFDVLLKKVSAMLHTAEAGGDNAK
jgi:DNA-binding response OmpR family regulator